MKYQDVNTKGDAVRAGLVLADRQEFELAKRAASVTGLGAIASNMEQRTKGGKHHKLDAMDLRYYEEPARRLRSAISEVANAPENSNIAHVLGALVLAEVRELDASAPGLNQMSEDVVPSRQDVIQLAAASGVQQFEDMLHKEAPVDVHSRR